MSNNTLARNVSTDCDVTHVPKIRISADVGSYWNIASAGVTMFRRNTEFRRNCEVMNDFVWFNIYANTFGILNRSKIDDFFFNDLPMNIHNEGTSNELILVRIPSMQIEKHVHPNNNPL